MRRKFKNFLKIVWAGILSFLGFILSPLTWWNDLFVNVPLAILFAYLMASIFSIFIEVNFYLFSVLVIFGYFLTNVLGFYLMELGFLKIYRKNEKIKNSLTSSLVFSLIAVLLVYLSIMSGLIDVQDTQNMMADVLRSL